MLKAGGLSIDFDDIHFAFCVSAWDHEEGKKEQCFLFLSLFLFVLATVLQIDNFIYFWCPI